LNIKITLEWLAKQGATQQQNAYVRHEYPCTERPLWVGSRRSDNRDFVNLTVGYRAIAVIHLGA
jgi:hypothetical protein